MKIHFLTEAALEIQEAVSYSQANFGLGEEFSVTIKESIAGIAADPRRFAKKRGGFQMVKLSRLPYLLIFHFDEASESVVFCALAHTSRRPGYWKSRI